MDGGAWGAAVYGVTKRACSFFLSLFFSFLFRLSNFYCLIFKFTESSLRPLRFGTEPIC